MSKKNKTPLDHKMTHVLRENDHAVVVTVATPTLKTNF